jgi:nucleotide-binding universal stress UspA family protein
MKNGKPEIVVGVSGSHASVAALRWAAEEAERIQARLRVVLAWTPEPHAYYAHIQEPAEPQLQERARRTLAAAVRSGLGPLERSDISTSLVKRMPERALVDSSAGAALLVLGSESGLTAGRSIGPVIRTCLSRAHCPVVIVSPENLPPRESTFAAVPGVVQGPMSLAAWTDLRRVGSAAACPGGRR